MMRRTRVLALACVLVALLACKKKKAPDPDPAPAAPAPTQGGGLTSSSWFTHKASGTKFLAPPGWNQKKGRNSVAFFAPDHTAVIAVGAYDKNKDPSATIMVTARELGLTNLSFKSAPKQTSLNGISAREASGSCKSNGSDATYNYATLTPGGPENLLLIYAVLANAPAQRQAEAKQSFQSFQKI